MKRIMNNFRPEKDQVITHRCDNSHAVGVRTYDKAEEQKSCIHPGEPFDLYRQNKKQVDDDVGIETGEGKEQRRNQHAIGKIAAEEKRGHGRPDHSNQEIEREPKRAPGAFEAVADEPEEPKKKNDPPAEGLRNKNVSDQPPDLALTDARGIEHQNKPKIRIQPNESEHEHVDQNNDAD